MTGYCYPLMPMHWSFSNELMVLIHFHMDSRPKTPGANRVPRCISEHGGDGEGNTLLSLNDSSKLGFRNMTRHYWRSGTSDTLCAVPIL